VLHARLVAQDGAARDAARRINSEHRHTVALLDQMQAQGLDKGGFAHAGHTADAEAKTLAGVRQQRGQQRIALGAVVGAGGFEQGDGLGDGAALLGGAAMQDAVENRRRDHATALRICSNTSFALAGIGVPGP
jgi:hypothetical protein